MPLRKALIYGGCHASILHNLLTSHFSGDVCTTAIVNYELIESGVPFPFERLREFDAVFYSPIENKGDYNTTHLVDACRAVGVDAFCYPWLEWHGYAPGATKGDFKNRFQWRYEDLVTTARSFSEFDSFVEWVSDSYPSSTTSAMGFDQTTTVLRSSEQRLDMPIRVTDYISEHYRYSRLFLVSDHPSLDIYLHVVRQMLSLLGIADDGRCESLKDVKVEPQWRWRMPILPQVESSLDLRFSDQCWVDDDVVPGRTLDLRSYLLLYYYSDSIILGPSDPAVMWHESDFNVACPVDPATRIVADRVPGNDDRSREKYRLLKTLSDTALPLDFGQLFQIDKSQWRCAWG